MASKIPVRRESSLYDSKSLPSIRQADASAKVRWSTLDGGKLEQLFPSFSIRAHKNVNLSGGLRRVERVFCTPAEQIAKRVFDLDEIEKVKGLALHRIDIQDDQIEALVARFDRIESVVFDEVFMITDAALAALRSLKKLKAVQIKLCPNIKKIDPLPLEQLEKIQTALAHPVGLDAARRLALSPVLSEVDFGTIAPIQKEELLCFKTAHETNLIKIQAQGSVSITPKIVEQLNQERRLAICVQGVVAPLDKPDPRRIVPLSAADLTVSETMTSKELIWIVQRSNKQILAASICNCEEIDYEAIIYLNELTLLTKLYFGKLPKATVRSVEVLLAPRLKAAVWPCLKEVRFYNTLLSDRALSLLANLSSLETVYFVDCTSFSLQGLKNFFDQTALLKTLALAGCPVADPLSVLEFRLKRSYVRIQADDPVDSTAVKMAKKEALERKAHPKIKRQYRVLPRFLGKTEPIDETAQFSGDTSSISRFYAERIAALKVEASEISADDWILADLFLQSFLNLRTAWAIRSELFRVGQFQNIDLDSPRNLQEIILHLTDSKEDRANVRQLCLNGLDIAELPEFVQKLDWPKLEKIEGLEPNADFLKKCPRLKPSLSLSQSVSQAREK